MEVKRKIDLWSLVQKKSFFLFGPRQTGKTTLIRKQLTSTDTLVINLLRSEEYLNLSVKPSILEEMIAASGCRIVAIDEIQKLPALLDEVHRLIEERNIKFLLTGSSARKLKRGGTNLLAGRAWIARLYPLTYAELGPSYDLNRYLLYGGLPPVYLSEDPVEELDSYVHTYLYEEIQAEGLVKKLQPFSRFLKFAALSSGEMLNFASLADDAQLPPSTVREHFQILEDTLIGHMLPAWQESKKRKAIQKPKFYYFDTGVTNMLAGIKTIERHSDLYGKRFEQFIFMELLSYLNYSRIKKELTYWRSVNGQEVDFLIGKDVAVEVKASEHVSRKHLKGLLALKEENVYKKYILVSNDKIKRLQDEIFIIHWQEFLTLLWGNELVK